jgi:hypothetical protein
VPLSERTLVKVLRFVDARRATENRNTFMKVNERKRAR